MAAAITSKIGTSNTLIVVATSRSNARFTAIFIGFARLQRRVDERPRRERWRSAATRCPLITPLQAFGRVGEVSAIWFQIPDEASY